jgi:hypothetical protein
MDMTEIPYGIWYTKISKPRQSKKMKTKYNTISNKIKKLKENNNNIHTNNSETKHTFFKRTENLTDVTFM